jgi:hypothetical protein
MESARESASPVDAQTPTDTGVGGAVEDATDAGGGVGGGDSAACPFSTPPAANTNTHLSDPSWTQTATSTGYVLHKTLNGYPNYGAGDGTSDILYAGGGTGAWGFNIPGAAVWSATLVVSVVADDGAGGQATGYSFNLWSNACGPFSNVANFQHGTPFASQFTDWTQISVPVNLTPGGTYQVTMENTTAPNAGDSPTSWIGIEWIEIRATTL